jgi:feruloyl esterase
MVITAIPCAMAAGKPDKAGCERLRTVKIPNAQITNIEFVTSGSLAPVGAFNLRGEPVVLQDLPRFCRVMGTSRPSADSEIRFEVWLPEKWNGRYQQLGNGGWAGSIFYQRMGPPLTHGFVAAGTDDGHRGPSDDASWALGHPEKLVDFGYRSLHETSVAARALSAAFYGHAPKYAYFNGCSDGGREALVSAQRYPEDFNGWVVGAPANDWSRLLGGLLRDSQLASRASFSSVQLNLLTRAALRACDAADGLADGIIANPPACNFDPHSLVCTPGRTEDCLSVAQADAAEAIYRGVSDPKSGVQIFPGRYGTMGTEADPVQWPLWITGPSPLGLSIASSHFKYVVYAEPSLDIMHVDPVRALNDSRQRVDAVLSALDPNLERVRAGGKKIIQYHGWSDSAIPADFSVSYYNAVAATLGGDIRDFYRLFLAPAMAHCAGGPGPNAFGGADNPGAVYDAQHDVVAAIQRWVEEGQAPEHIIATKFEGDDPHRKVVRARRLCVYPAVAKWTGKGSSDDATNFVCADP